MARYNSLAARQPSALPTRSLPLLFSLCSRFVKASPVYLASAALEAKEKKHEPLTEEEYIFKLVMAVVLVVTGGVFVRAACFLSTRSPLELRLITPLHF